LHVPRNETSDIYDQLSTNISEMNIEKGEKKEGCYGSLASRTYLKRKKIFFYILKLF
jgi:hypothetical protein